MYGRYACAVRISRGKANTQRSRGRDDVEVSGDGGGASVDANKQKLHHRRVSKICGRSVTSPRVPPTRCLSLCDGARSIGAAHTPARVIVWTIV